MGDRAKAVELDPRPPRFVDLLRLRAFSVLYAAEAQSVAGDQLARIALAVLVFDRTGSAAATSLTYATTFLPAILGGVVLARIGDRLPRRAVMVGCDVVRASLFVAMALPGLPLAAVAALLVVAVFLGPAFSASQVSYLASALSSEQFRSATGVRMVTNQAAQVAGFAVGGVLVGVLQPRGALLVDAATYVLSAFVIGALLRTAATSSRSPGDSSAAAKVAANRAFTGLWRDRQVRVLIALSALAGFFIVPEGLAVPFGDDIAASTTVTGLLLAAIPLGGAVGAVLLVRLVPKRRRRQIAGWMAIACGVPLIATALRPPWPVVLVTWFVSGALAAYQIEVMTAVVQLIPDRLRSHLVGVTSAVLLGAQGLGLIVFGAVGEWFRPGIGIALAGAVGSLLACWTVHRLRGVTGAETRHAATPRHRAGNRKLGAVASHSSGYGGKT